MITLPKIYVDSNVSSGALYSWEWGMPIERWLSSKY